MLKNILAQLKEIIRSRMFILTLFFLILAIILVRRIFVLQIINGEDYLDKFTYRIQKDIELAAPRGTIYDCNGVALAYNQLAYSVSIEDSTLLTNNETKNTMISTLVDLINSTGNTLNYDIPIDLSETGEFEFTAGENTVLRFKKDIYCSETLTQEQIDATAEDMYNYMKSSSFFNLSENYTTEKSLQIISIRYDLFMKRYEKYLSVTVANDVNDELVAAIKENATSLPGVTIDQDYSRVYTDSKYFSNITGYIGSISEDELAEYEEEGNTDYSSGDMIGKTGIESYYETTLKGTKGSQTLYVNSLGSVLGTSDTVEATAGNDVYLSIDSELQEKVYDMLEERIAGILLAYMTSDVYGDNEECYIPIKDFYYALIDNSVISLDHLSAEDADSDEKSLYSSYKDYETTIYSNLKGKMKKDYSDLDSEYQSYITMAYDMLKDNSVIDLDNLSDDDSTLAAWKEKSISFADLIKYLISQNCVDISLLDLSEQYVDTDEIYSAVVEYISQNLSTYSGFEKKVYYYMLQSDVISGREIELILYSQGILDKDSDEDYASLKSGSLSPYTFMYNKIYNLEITPDMLALKPCSGSCIITDVETGQVKALVSYPGYDANKINNSSYFSALVNNNSSPFYNRVTQQTLAPGSTFKPISAITGLETGTITLDTYVYDNVEFTKVEPHAYCWSSSSHGTINVVDAIKYSCNYFFYELGLRLGLDENGDFSDSLGLSRLSEYASLFGLNEVTGLELPESEPNISTDSSIRSAIGQGTNAYTAAELCRYVTAIANNGSLYHLTLLDKIVDDDNKVVEEKEPDLERTIELSDTTWDAVHTGMYKVCNESSYKEKMAGRGVVIAGKSGTAQESETEPNHGLFVGYAPYDDPEIAMTMIIPNGYGSSKVLDLFADVMCYYFDVDQSDDTGERHANVPAVSSQSTD